MPSEKSQRLGSFNARIRSKRTRSRAVVVTYQTAAASNLLKLVTATQSGKIAGRW